MKSLRRTGDVHLLAHVVEVGQRAAEAALLGEHGDDGRAAGLVVGGQARGVRDGGQRALGRRGALDLGDDLHAVAAGSAAAQRLDAVDGAVQAGDLGLQVVEADPLLAFGEVERDAFDDLGKYVHRRQLPSIASQDGLHRPRVRLGGRRVRRLTLAAPEGLRSPVIFWWDELRARRRRRRRARTAAPSLVRGRFALARATSRRRPSPSRTWPCRRSGKPRRSRRRRRPAPASRPPGPPPPIRKPMMQRKTAVQAAGVLPWSSPWDDDMVLLVLTGVFRRDHCHRFGLVLSARGGAERRAGLGGGLSGASVAPRSGPRHGRARPTGPWNCRCPRPARRPASRRRSHSAKTSRARSHRVRGRSRRPARPARRRAPRGSTTTPCARTTAPGREALGGGLVGQDM